MKTAVLSTLFSLSYNILTDCIAAVWGRGLEDGVKNIGKPPQSPSNSHYVSSYDSVFLFSSTGHVLSVSTRLDARHTWLPSFKTLVSQTRYMVVSVKNPCATQFDVNVRGRLALVYAGNSNCSAFTKVMYMCNP